MSNPTFDPSAIVDSIMQSITDETRMDVSQLLSRQGVGAMLGVAVAQKAYFEAHLAMGFNRDEALQLTLLAVDKFG